MDFKIKLKSDVYDDPINGNTSLGLLDSQKDRHVLRDGVTKIAKHLDEKIKINSELVDENSKSFHSDIVAIQRSVLRYVERIDKDIETVEEILGLAANDEDLRALQEFVEGNFLRIEKLEIANLSCKREREEFKESIYEALKNLNNRLDYNDTLITEIKKDIVALENINGKAPKGFLGRLKWLFFG